MSTKIICDYCKKVLGSGEGKQLMVDGNDIFHDIDFCPDCLEKVKEGILNMIKVHYPDPREYEYKTKKGKPIRSKVEIDRRKCIDLWNAGKKPVEIAKEMNVSSQMIYYQLKKFRSMYGEDVVKSRAIPYELPKVGDDD